MHTLSISALILASTAAGRTFFNVPVGLDKSAVNDAFSSRGIQGFDPNSRPNADGLYMANSNSNSNVNRVDSSSVINNNSNNNNDHYYIPEKHMEHDQLMELHSVPEVEPFTIAPYIRDDPMPNNGPTPPGHPIAVPLAPAREYRPGLLVEPPVARNPSAQDPQALRPNPPQFPPQQMPQAQRPAPPPPPPSFQPLSQAAPMHPAAIPPPQLPTPAATAAPTIVVHDNGVLTSTMLVMVTTSGPPMSPMSPLPQPTVDAFDNIAEEDNFEDSSASVKVATVAVLASQSTHKGPVKLEPLMFAKAKMTAFKPEDIDQFTFPSAE
ncbi:hypothetical protein IWW38_002493, partial [Coemansia aciculifera]